MSEPKLVAERAINRSTNQQVGRATLPKKPSEKSANQFKAQNFLLNDKANNLARDNIANKLSSVADGSYPKCSATSGNPCIDTGGYKDKRAYSGSGMAGWSQAGLAGNYVNSTNTKERIEFVKVYLPRVGMGITAMAATIAAPQAVPYIVKSAAASYMSMNAASYTATGLLADEIFIGFTSSVLVQGAPVFTPAGIAGYALGDYLETSNWK